MIFSPEQLARSAVVVVATNSRVNAAEALAQ
jgi:hypothetical protein